MSTYAKERWTTALHLGLRGAAGERVTGNHSRVESQAIVLHPKQMRGGRGVATATRSAAGAVLAVMEGLQDVI